MIVVKIGGSIVDGLHLTALQDIKNIIKRDRLVLVHGGGKEVTNIATKLGKEQKFIISPSGVKSRYTDKETAEIYTMVMSGKINKTIVGMLLRHGVKAVGISGLDGLVLKAQRKKKLLIVNEKGRKMAVDGGYTGKIHSVDPSLMNILLDQGYTPVISPIAISDEFDFLNVDGDRAAAYIAGGLKAQMVVFITNVPGLILEDKLVTNITLEQANTSLSKIGYGMEKKIIAAREAIEMGVNESVIASGKVEYPISAAMAHTNCTVITAS